MRERPGFPVRLTPTASAATRGRVPSVPSKPLVHSTPSMASDAVRARMVQRLAAQGIADARVLQAMGVVERHLFVDSALVNQAYEDTSLPIGLGQTISKPNVVARMLELLLAAPSLANKPSERLGRVLEIGTGCGYQATVLSHVASEVYSIERLRGLHERARINLRSFRLATVHLLLGDGMVGYAKGAPYAESLPLLAAKMSRKRGSHSSQLVAGSLLQHARPAEDKPWSSSTKQQGASSGAFLSRSTLSP